VSNGPWAVVRGPWDGEQAWRPRAYGATNLSKLETRTTHHGSGARAAFSVADCGSTVVAPCNRLRRFLKRGLGPGFGQMVCSPSVSVRLSRHTDVGIGFRRRDKGHLFRWAQCHRDNAPLCSPKQHVLQCSACSIVNLAGCSCSPKQHVLQLSRYRRLSSLCCAACNGVRAVVK